MLLAISLLVIQTGCKKDDDNDPTGQGYAVIGDLPDSPFFNALNSKISIVPLSSDVPILINSSAVAGLTADQKNYIQMAYKNGMPVAMMDANQEAANKLVELTEHVSPITYSSDLPEKLAIIGVAQVQNIIKKFLLPEEKESTSVIDIFTQKYMDWVEGTLTESKNHLFKESNSFQLSDTALVSQTVHTVNVNGFVLQVTGDVVAIYGAEYNSWYVFPAFHFNCTRTPTTEGYYLQFEDNPYSITFKNGNGPDSCQVVDIQPTGTPIGGSVTQGSTHGFSVGASVNDIGIVTASFTYSCSFSNSRTYDINPVQIIDNSHIIGPQMGPQIYWHWNTPVNVNSSSYFGEYPINYYYILLYNEANVGQAHLGGGWFQAINQGGSGLNPGINTTIFDFYLPSKGSL